MVYTYHFDLPGPVVWSTHILIGLFFIYVGGVLLSGKKLPQAIYVTLIVLGVLALAYHAHIWYVERKKE
jgi:hypothetical protein